MIISLGITFYKYKDLYLSLSPIEEDALGSEKTCSRLLFDVFGSVLQDRTASIWRLPDLVHVVTLKGHKRRIFSVEFSPVDQCVMTASGDKTVKIWAISDGSCLKTFEGHTSSVLRASFITDGTQFVSCGKFH